MISPRAIDAIEASDTNDLLRVIDGYCAALEWQLLLELKTRCREALSRGKQLWGVEEHIRYRLALEAPAGVAGPIVSEGQSRFTLGPLAEVVASTKNWSDLRPHLEAGPIRRTVAAERVIRGDEVDEDIADMPSSIMDWEPRYPVAKYKADRVQTPSPSTPEMVETNLPTDFEAMNDAASEDALGDLVQPWTEESNGRCQTVTVQGSHLEAIRALGLTQSRVARLDTGGVLRWMAWAGASGGAHGRRRGSAAGRYLAWWVITNLADLDWPADPVAVGEAAQRLKWHWFDDGSPETGWVLRLSVEDQASNLAWAISAIDVD